MIPKPESVFNDWIVLSENWKIMIKLLTTLKKSSTMGSAPTLQVITDIVTVHAPGHNLLVRDAIIVLLAAEERVERNKNGQLISRSHICFIIVEKTTIFIKLTL